MLAAQFGAQFGRLRLSGFRDAARSVEDPKRDEIAMLVVAEHDAALIVVALGRRDSLLERSSTDPRADSRRSS